MQSFKDAKKNGYHKLIICQKGRIFINLLYKKTEKFPRSEIFGLQSQIRRAAVSFLLNLVEGQRRSSKADFLRFLDMSDSSLAEVEACMEIALDLSYFSLKDFEELENLRCELAIMLVALINSIKKINSLTL